MNKSKLAERLADWTGMSKVAAKDAVDGVFDVIAESLANGEEVRILGFGAFDTRERPRAPRATRGQASPSQSQLPPGLSSSRVRRSGRL